jgi:predicted nuclease with TOPRIM domain
MRDFAFYNAGCTEPRGARRLIIPFRRLLRRILRPIFFRQADLFQELGTDLDRLNEDRKRYQTDLDRSVKERAGCRQELSSHDAELKAHQAEIDRHRVELERLAERQDRAEALYWDHVALTRRLAALEDQVEALLHQDMSAKWSNGLPRSFPPS